MQLGHVYATPGALGVQRERLVECLNKHMRGDWGIMSDEDKRLNDQALVEGSRVLSAYPIDPDLPAGSGHGNNTLWIITEADRFSTTLLLPEEY